MRRVVIAGVAIAALALGAVSCGSNGGPSAHCVDWDTHSVSKMVTPAPVKTYKRVWEPRTRKYVNKWVDGRTPAPYLTTIRTRHCDQWVTESPTPANT